MTHYDVVLSHQPNAWRGGSKGWVESPFSMHEAIQQRCDQT